MAEAAASPSTLPIAAGATIPAVIAFESPAKKAWSEEAMPSLFGKRSRTISVMQGVSSDQPKAIRKTGPIALTGVGWKNRCQSALDRATPSMMVKPIPTIEIAGGARYTRERKQFSKENLYGIGTFNTANTVYPGSNQIGFLQGRFADSNVSPEATLTWRPDSRKTLFIAYKTGFKSGGFGVTSPLQTGTRIGDTDFESEQARGFEVGAKGLFLNGRLRLNVAAFAYKFTDLQVTSISLCS